jgi:hypothetical protein
MTGIGLVPNMTLPAVGRELQQRQRLHVQPPEREPGSSPRRNKHFIPLILYPLKG